ncbi:MAG: hypothetical protein IPM71_02455 [Bacteroidota bacterium]|nr:MAG: hypothetical protein IPM71_02455 [Bacteroidota bacterium]
MKGNLWRIIIRWFLVLFVLVLFSFLISLAIAPLHKKASLEGLVNSDSILVTGFDSILNHQDITPLLKERVYKEALLKLAENDSIQLVINLPDSTVCLYIKGVKIHESKALKIKRDALLDKVSNLQYAWLFNEPIAIQTQFATIVKEPIVERQAPKDTIEAAANAYQPDTLVQKPAFLLMELNYGIRVILEQDRRVSFEDKWEHFKFYSHIIHNDVQFGLNNFMKIQKHDFYPTLTLEIPMDELRAIYRALPTQSWVVIRL